MPEITALYAGILGLMVIVLATFPGVKRGQLGIGAGNSGNEELELAMRRHGNFIEWVPLVLILLGLLEMRGIGSTVIHTLGAGLVVARVLHAVGISHTPGGAARSIGAASTALITAVCSVWLIVGSL